MSGYEKGNETKRRLILAMHKKLEEKKASEITVREFAAENHCSPAALYRHFESLEYLIILGSIRFFSDYMEEYGKILDRDGDLLKVYLDGWKLYNKYAFERPDLYYRLFWGQYHSMFSDALDTYYELFPLAGSTEYPAYFYTLLYTENVEERDFLMLRRAATHGLITDEDAEYFSRTNTLIVKGMLEKYMDMSEADRKKGALECDALLAKNLERVAKKPG